MKRLSPIAGVFASLLMVSGAIGGDLNPPMGPIEPTMVSLDTIEPRVALRDVFGNAGAEHLVTQAGN